MSTNSTDSPEKNTAFLIRLNNKIDAARLKFKNKQSDASVELEEKSPDWLQHELINTVKDINKEKRSTRRWGIFFKFAMIVYVLGIIGMSTRSDPLKDSTGGHSAVIRINGAISAGTKANSESIIASLRKAVAHKDTKGVILLMNSPGGSPVESDYVYNEIRDIKRKNPNLPIHAVITDLCASGCYYIASAADNIYVNKGSIVGSIGVIMGSFGFTDIMEKVGVERRLITAGAHKALLDPFSPKVKMEDDHFKGMLAEVHQVFIDSVKAGRGSRLKETPDMFSGLVWSGQSSINLGLADGLANADRVATDIIKAKNRVDFSAKETLFRGLAKKMGASLGVVLKEALISAEVSSNTPRLY